MKPSETLFLVVATAVTCATCITIGIVDSKENDISEFNSDWLVTHLSNEDDMTYDKVMETISMMTNLSGVIGPYDMAVATAAEHVQKPYVVTSLVPREQELNPFVVQMFPGYNDFALAVDDVVQFYKWRKIAVIHDNTYGTFILDKLLSRQSNEIRILELPAGNDTEMTLRRLLKDLRAHYYHHFMVICHRDKTDLIFKEALYLSMLSTPYSWIAVNMGLHKLSVSEYVDLRANLTIVELMTNQNHSECKYEDENSITLNNAILQDGVRVLKQLINSRQVDGNRRKRRLSIQERKLKKFNTTGCTGYIFFQENGRRKEYYLQLVSLKGLRNGTMGTWSSARPHMMKRLSPSWNYSIYDPADEEFGDRVLRVTTKIEEPFVMMKEGHELLKGNDKFEGFCVDVMKEVAEMLSFKYELSLVPDGKFGSLKSYGWTGMINEIIQDNADIALAPFSITPERSGVVDFTKPFMTKGTTVVLKKPQRTVSKFQFLAPLSRGVWISILVSFASVTFVHFFISRGQPDQHPGIAMHLLECTWHTWGALLRNNMEGVSRNISSRIVTSAWWFFSLIVISIYTANLAAFLTVYNAYIPVSSAADLAYQSDYKYGTVEGSQIEFFFKNTQITHYAKMWAYMNITKGVQARRVENGLNKTRYEKYAFIWDSPTLRHMISTDCDLIEVGQPFDLKGYGIATKKHVPYTEKISFALLRLNDAQRLQALESKWWPKPTCPDQNKGEDTKALELIHVAGIYMVLLAGVTMSIFGCVIICIINFRKRRKQDKKENPSANGPPADAKQTTTLDDGFTLHPTWSNVFNHTKESSGRMDANK